MTPSLGDHFPEEYRKNFCKSHLIHIFSLGSYRLKSGFPDTFVQSPERLVKPAYTDRRQKNPYADNYRPGSPAYGFSGLQGFPRPAAAVFQDGRGDQLDSQGDTQRQEDRIVQVTPNRYKVRDQVNSQTSLPSVKRPFVRKQKPG